MGNTSETVNELDKIQRAANTVCDDILLNNIRRLIEYRRLVAIDILKYQTQENHQYLKKVYEHSDYQLKELLGIK